MDSGPLQKNISKPRQIRKEAAVVNSYRALVNLGPSLDFVFFKSLLQF